MSQPPLPREALPLLGEVYRESRTGTLVLDGDEGGLRAAVREGQIVGIRARPTPDPPAGSAAPAPDDSAQLKLDRVLAEVGIRPPPAAPARPTAVPPAPPARDLREQLLEALAAPGATGHFREAVERDEDAVPTAGATEPLILEAVRRVEDMETVRDLLGDLDRRLAATTALAEERTLTLTEGYLLSRIDGACTTRQILQIVPLDSDETERSLAGLILTGRVKPQLTPLPRPQRRPAAAAPANPAPSVGTDAPETTTPPVDAAPPPAVRPAASEVDEETQARRREILELFQRLPLLNHFEVLGVEPGCNDGAVRQAHVSLVKRFHPDAQRKPGLEDLQDVLAAIFIRVGEAWEVLGKARGRADYEARLGQGTSRSPTESPRRPGEPGEARAAVASPEETLREAQLLLGASRYWDAIRVLEQAVPRLEPQHHQHRGRVLLARAYARNPKWVHRAEETLQDVVREDPSNAEAHYELGMLYKEGGLTARAQAMFRKAVRLQPGHRQAAAEIGPEDPSSPPPGGLLRRLFGKGA